jgi:hypothetical protein
MRSRRGPPPAVGPLALCGEKIALAGPIVKLLIRGTTVSEGHEVKNRYVDRDGAARGRGGRNTGGQKRAPGER